MARNPITLRDPVWNDYVVKLVTMRWFVPFVQWDCLFQLDSSLGYDHCHDWLWCHWLSLGLSLILVAGSLHLPWYGWVLVIGLHGFATLAHQTLSSRVIHGLFLCVGMCLEYLDWFALAGIEDKLSFGPWLHGSAVILIWPGLGHPFPSCSCWNGVLGTYILSWFVIDCLSYLGDWNQNVASGWLGPSAALWELNF